MCFIRPFAAIPQAESGGATPFSLENEGIKVRVLVVDDHEVVRRGVISLLKARSNVEICGEASDGQEAIDKASELQPDVIVMDVSMPRLNGIEATRTIRSLLPSTEVLVLSQHDAPEMARQAFKAGARGYVIKSSVGQNLTSALEKVSRRECFFDPAISEIAAAFDLQEILQRSAALEQALRENEELYRSTFELAAVGLAHVSPEGHWLRVNRKVCEILGYSEGELLQRTFQEMTHPDDLEADLAQAQRVLRGEIPSFSMEKRYIRKDGSPVWVNLTVSVARDSGGKIKHFISMIEDISARRRAEDALKQSQAQLTLALESSCTAMFDWDIVHERGGWNEQLAALYDFHPAGRYITASEWQSLFHPDDVERLTQEAQRAYREGKDFQFEFRTVLGNGEMKWILSHGRIVHDETGRSVGMIGTHTDITERKRAEQALRKSEEQLRAAFGQSYSFLVLLSVDGTILEVNRAALEAAGTGRDQLVGKKFWEPWWSPLPDEVERLQAVIAKAAAGHAVREECYFCLPDGTRRFADRTISPVKDSYGSVVMLVASGLDITEQKELRDKLEERVRTRTHELQKKNQALYEQAQRVRELSGKLLHVQDEERRRLARELHDSAGQLIAAVQMNLIPLKVPAEKISLEFGKAIHDSLACLQQLSEELRTVSHLLHPPLLDEAGLPSALRWYVEGFSERSRIDVQLELPPDLARMSSDMEVTLFRVVQECLTNIHRHSGSKRASIRVSGLPQEISLEVRDYGQGMPSGQNGSSHPRSGVGIQGMRERVHQLNGHFDIQSLSDGTVVTARLPLAAISSPVAG
jgi:PAS domain S-box-containing protein